MASINDKPPRRYEVSRDDALLLFGLVKSHCAAIHNWTASAVERSEHEYAQKLVKDLRTYQRLFASLNVEAHETCDKFRS